MKLKYKRMSTAGLKLGYIQRLQGECRRVETKKARAQGWSPKEAKRLAKDNCSAIVGHMGRRAARKFRKQI